MAMFDFWKRKKVSDDIEKDVITNQITTDFDDGAFNIEGGVHNYIFNYDWTANSQAELIETYREVANYNEVDFAIEDIINEMVSFSEDEDPVKLSLDDVELSENIKKLILERWDKLSNILKLKDTIHHRAKRFYVDGRLAYQKVVDGNKTSKGILNVVELDTRYIQKVRDIKYNEQSKTIESIDEMFVYNENDMRGDKKPGHTVNGSYQYKEALQLNKDSVTFVTSGMTDPKTGFVISWLHKAVKPANQLRMMENSLVVYRITRAPERRVFYIDVGNLPKSKAEQYMNNLKNSYKNKMTYDPESGTFQDKKHMMTMQEDFWLPRSQKGGTEVSTLPGGANLDSIEDVQYFLKRLYKALNIPASRLEQDTLTVIGGRAAEINRDELKFSKFVSKIRKRFNMMFRDLLRSELILTKVITDEEWKEIDNKIKFIYAQDMYLEERKHFEMTRDRLELVKDMQEHIGRYYSNAYIRSEILRQTEEEQEEQDKQIKEEESNKQYQPPEDEVENNF